MMGHTEGKLELNSSDATQIDARRGRPICETNWSENSEGDARRLVACWNALVDFETEAIEEMGAEGIAKWFGC